MTLVDSLDSILMLYSYTGFVDRSWRIFESSTPPITEVSLTQNTCPMSANVAPHIDQSHDTVEEESKTINKAVHDDRNDVAGRRHEDHVVLVKRSTMSQLSIILTTMSILLAFGCVKDAAVHWQLICFQRSVSLIEIMGLIGANCNRCEAAASAPGGGGLAGAWWRAWAVVSRALWCDRVTLNNSEATENYGYIGAGIVGVFVVLVGGWYICRRIIYYYK